MIRRGRGGGAMTCLELFGRGTHVDGRASPSAYISSAPPGHHILTAQTIRQSQPLGATMKLARFFLALLTTTILAACGDSVTAPEAAPADAPAMDGATT